MICERPGIEEKEIENVDVDVDVDVIHSISAGKKSLEN